MANFLNFFDIVNASGAKRPLAGPVALLRHSLTPLGGAPDAHRYRVAKRCGHGVSERAWGTRLI